MVDRTLLIELVRTRAALWDKSDKMYYNRDLRPKMWEEVGRELGVGANVARRNWELLRDMFRKKLKETNVMTGPAAKPLASWHYYDAMSFLIDVMRPRASSSYLTAPDANFQDSGEASNECFYIKSEVDMFINHADDASNEILQAQTGLDVFKEDDDYTVDEQDGVAGAVGAQQAKDASSTSAQNDLHQQSNLASQMKKLPSFEKESLNIQPVKCQLLDAPQSSQDEEDDDLSFFKSLLPYLKTLRPIQKMKLRSTILNNVITALQEAGANDTDSPGT